MVTFPRELSDDLAELIAEKARVCGGGAFDIWEAICEQFGQPAPTAVADERYTCIGKGGEYVRLGTAIGAGQSRGEIIEVYRDEKQGQLYFRETSDFFDRMQLLGGADKLTEVAP
jgi:hypothetical protein